MSLEAFLKIKFQSFINSSTCPSNHPAHQHPPRPPGGIQVDLGRWNLSGTSFLGSRGFLSVNRAWSTEPPPPAPLNVMQQRLNTEFPPKLLSSGVYHSGRDRPPCRVTSSLLLVSAISFVHDYPKPAFLDQGWNWDWMVNWELALLPCGLISCKAKRRYWLQFFSYIQKWTTGNNDFLLLIQLYFWLINSSFGDLLELLLCKQQSQTQSYLSSTDV